MIYVVAVLFFLAISVELRLVFVARAFKKLVQAGKLQQEQIKRLERWQRYTLGEPKDESS